MALCQMNNYRARRSCGGRRPPGCCSVQSCYTRCMWEAALTTMRYGVSLTASDIVQPAEEEDACEASLAVAVAALVGV